MKSEYFKIYKKNILNNAHNEGWEIYKKNDNVYYLYKKKEQGENFNLQNDIILLHKGTIKINKLKKDN